MFARDLMSRKPIAVEADAPIGRAVQLMRDKGVSGVAVVDDEGQLCGMLTEGDILQRSEFNLASGESRSFQDADFLRRYIKSHGGTVRDCMTCPVIAASPTDSVFDLVARMRQHGIKRLPVVEDGKLIGIVSRRDVLGAVMAERDAVAQGDDALRLAAATRLRSELGIGQEEVQIAVRNGVVDVAGPILTDLQRQAIRLVVERIAGVAGVRFVEPAATAAAAQQRQ